LSPVLEYAGVMLGNSPPCLTHGGWSGGLGRGPDKVEKNTGKRGIGVWYENLRSGINRIIVCRRLLEESP